MKRPNRYAIVFTACVLAMPTCIKLFSGFHADSAREALVMGALLGVAHLVLRPVLRFVSAPIGCLTLGLIQPALDLGILYACDWLVEGFSITSLFDAILAVVLLNAVCLIAAGRR